MPDIVNIKSFFSRHEAEVARGLLENNGILSIVSADDCAGYRPHLTLGMNNVQLLVQESDVSKAKKILRVLDEPVDEGERS